MDAHERREPQTFGERAVVVVFCLAVLAGAWWLIEWADGVMGLGATGRSLLFLASMFLVLVAYVFIGFFVAVIALLAGRP